MKKIIRVSSILLLLILAILTFVSRTVYNRSLPRVSAVYVTPGFIPITHIEDTPVMAAGAWQVTTVNINNNEHVSYGDTLLHFNQQEYQWEAPPATGLLSPKNGYIIRLATGLHRITEPGIPLFFIRDEILDRGNTYPFTVPRETVFYQGNGLYIIFALSTRPWFFGPENYVTAISVDILRENDTHAAIAPTCNYTDITNIPIAWDIHDWLNDRDAVWVRER